MYYLHLVIDLKCEVYGIVDDFELNIVPIVCILFSKYASFVLCVLTDINTNKNAICSLAQWWLNA